MYKQIPTTTTTYNKAHKQCDEHQLPSPDRVETPHAKVVAYQPTVLYDISHVLFDHHRDLMNAQCVDVKKSCEKHSLTNLLVLVQDIQV